MTKLLINLRVHSYDPGFLRVYYRNAEDDKGEELYCLQPGPGEAPELHCCTPSGEPEFRLHPDFIAEIEAPGGGHDFAEEMAVWLTRNRSALNVRTRKEDKESHQGTVTALQRLLYNCCTGCQAPEWRHYKDIQVWPSRKCFDRETGERRVMLCFSEDADFFTIYGRRQDEFLDPITDCASRADADVVRELFLTHFIQQTHK